MKGKIWPDDDNHRTITSHRCHGWHKGRQQGKVRELRGEDPYHHRPASVSSSTLVRYPGTTTASLTGLRQHSPSCPGAAPAHATLVEFHF